MKAFGHTKTLFIKGGKYKWAYDYDHCTECGTCNFKHKSKGLCTSCYDKKRATKVNRKISKRKAQKKYIKGNLEVFNEYQNKWHTEYYRKNREVLNLLNKGRYHQKVGNPVLVIYNKPIPYMDIVKPRFTHGTEYEEWKKRDELFQKVKDFLRK